MDAGWQIVRGAVVIYLVAIFACPWPASAEAAEQGKADVVLRSGKIYTADPLRSIKQAIAFTGNTIVAVGTDADVEKLMGPNTKVVDLGGKLVLRGCSTPLSTRSSAPSTAPNAASKE